MTVESVRLRLTHCRPYPIPARIARAEVISIYVHGGPDSPVFLGQRKHLGRRRYRRVALEICPGTTFTVDWPLPGACLRPGEPGMDVIITWQTREERPNGDN